MRYAKTLFIHCPQVITAAGAEAGCWIGGFPHVVRLVMVGWERFAHEWGDTFALFHRISPIIKSLCVDFVLFSFSQLFNLILSFSLLEDLSVTGYCYLPVKLGRGSDGPLAFAQLELEIMGGIEPIACRLLSLSGGTLPEARSDIPLALEKCSHTLESLDVTYGNSCGMPVSSAFPWKWLTPFFFFFS